MRLCSSVVLVLCTMSGAYAQGVITTIAGTDITYPGNSFSANSASFGQLQGVAVHPITGEVYFASQSQSLILKFNPVKNSVSVVAGIGIGAYSGDGGPAANAALNGPRQIAFDTLGNLYIADNGNSLVRRIDPTGVITSVASGFGPASVVVAPDGTLYVSDNTRIYRIDSDGTKTVIAGGAQAGFSGDGGPAVQALLGSVQALAFDDPGKLLIVDNKNNRIRQITKEGVISTFAGNGVAGNPVNGPATSVPLLAPTGLAVDAFGNVFFSSGGRLVKVGVNGILTILNLDASTYFLTSPGPIANALMDAAELAFDGAGNLYGADSGTGYLHWTAPSGLTQVVAAYAPGFGLGDKGPAVSAGLSGPAGLASLGDGTLLIADQYHQRVRRLSPSGTIETFAGNGLPGIPMPGPALSVPVDTPSGVARDSVGNTFVSSRFPPLKINPSGVLSILSVDALGPNGIAVDPQNDLFVADHLGHRVLKISPAGTQTIFAGTGEAGFSKWKSSFM